MDYRFGDIVLLPFPFTDQSASKKRPAVIVSGARYNRSRPDAVVMAVTSQLRQSAIHGDVSIPDWQAAGLLKPSSIKPIFATLDQTMIIRTLGRLSALDRAKLQRAIHATLAE